MRPYFILLPNQDSVSNKPVPFRGSDLTDVLRGNKGPVGCQVCHGSSVHQSVAEPMRDFPVNTIRHPNLKSSPILRTGKLYLNDIQTKLEYKMRTPNRQHPLPLQATAQTAGGLDQFFSWEYIRALELGSPQKFPSGTPKEQPLGRTADRPYHP